MSRRQLDAKGAALGFFSYEPFPLDRWACLACDVCDRVLIPEGGLSPKRLRDSPPNETAPHFRPRDELSKLAMNAGWRVSSERGTERVSWTCAECEVKPVTGG